CADIPAGDCDCDGNQLDALGVCGGDCTADADSDGICDDVDDCVGALDACGVCNGPGEIYECGCSDIPAGDCDCDGNQLDALGVCGGDCTADADADGICDDADDCVGTLDACGICNGPGAIYDCGCSDIPAGDCDCDGNQLDALGVCGGGCAADADADGICDDVDDCVGAYDDCGVCNGDGICDGSGSGEATCYTSDEVGGCQTIEFVMQGGPVLGFIYEDGTCSGCWADDIFVVVNDESGACTYWSGYNDCGITAPSDCVYQGTWGPANGGYFTDEFNLTDVLNGDDVWSFVVSNAYGAGNTPVYTFYTDPDGLDNCTTVDPPVDCDDVDEDGICDDVDDCVGAYDDCGVCNGDGSSCIDCCETDLVWNQELSDSSVECIEDLPASCDDFATGVMAVNECDGSEYEAVCLQLSDLPNDDLCTAEATTAKRDSELGEGEYDATDGAIRIYGLSALGGADSDYFVEDPASPLSFQYSSADGTARLTGRVYCRENSAQWFDIDAAFNDGQVASDWLAEDPNHSLLINDDPDQEGYQPCDVNEDEITVFTMLAPSVMTAGGDLTGYLELEHMPVSLNKRFQLGEGANNHNCENGFGGWFKWDGMINGSAMSGLSGDIVVDLGDCTEGTGQCDKSVAFNIRAFDSDCGRLFSEVFTVTRDDTTPPTILDGPADETVECDNVPAMAGPESISAEDNCGEEITVSEGVEVMLPGSCPDNYYLQRRWTVTDLCGNESVHEQIVTVVDTTAPELTIPADYTAECSDEHPMEDASAMDNCGEVTITEDAVTTPGACAGDYTITRTFTATDECGNSSSATQTITVVDTTSPVITADVNITEDCEDYSEADAYALASDNCGEVTLTWTDAPVSGGCITPVGAYLRTYTATDDCGNASTLEQIITLIDDQAPVIDTAASDATEECDGAGNTDALNAWLNSNGGASASDNCSNIEWSNDFEGLSDDCGATGSVTVTFTVTDDCDNSSSTTATFTIEDTTAPTFDSVPGDYTAECSDAHPLDDATASDICGGASVAVVADTTAGSCDQQYVVTRTFTATDDCGNTSTVTQVITIVDTTAPEFTYVPADYTAECSDEHPMEDATATDNCGEVSVTVDEVTTPGACTGDYTVTRTFTATDECGNSSTAVQTITIVDTTAPVFDPYTPTTVVECSDGDGDDLNYLPLTATDNCGSITYSVESMCMSGGCLWTIMRVWTATDDCGNSTTVEQYLMLSDTTAPEVTAPADYTVSADAADCTADISETAAGSPSYSDNCGDTDCWGANSLTVSYEDSAWEYTCTGDDDNTEGTRTLTRTWYVEDRCGNIGEATQTITVTDETAPMGSVEDDSVACASYDSAIEYGSHSESDNCDSDVAVSWEQTAIINVEGAGCYQVERTYTFADDCGNNMTAVQTITVYDDVAPEVSGDIEVQIECSEYPDENIYIEASDDCGDVTITFDDTPVSGGCVQPVGMYMRLYTVTDECGNSSSFEQFLRLVDTTAPELTIPADYTIECDQDIIYDDASATDNCDGDVAIELTTEIIDGDCPQSYTIERTFTATDDCDNSTTATQTITVQDTTAPDLTIPADYTAECSDEHPLEDASATDNCGEVTITLVADTTAGDCAQAYTVTRAFTATDECGNSTSATQTITIQDTTAPTFNETLPSDMTVECDNVPEMAVLTASDNCQDVTVMPASSTADGDCPHSYTITRSWSVSDDCGNSTSHTQTITVQDTTAPELIIPADYTAECSDEHSLDDASATDNCGEVTITEVADTTYSCTYSYVVTRTFTAADECGNSSTATQTITIQDTTAPVISGDVEVLIACEDYDSEVAHATSTDNCGNVTLTWTDTQVSGGCVLPIGQYVRNYTATDECGNSSTFEQILTLTDETAPTFDFVPADYTVECSDEMPMEDATASDNCSGATVTVSTETIEGACPQSYQIVRTFTATDNCDNSTTATQTITVQDTTAPALTIPADYTVECSDDMPMDDASATDNCGEVTIDEVQEIIEGDCAGNYTITREFTATDECGNSTTLTQTITVEDTTAPEFTSVPADYTVECSDDMPMDDATASDNCGEVTIDVMSETTAGDCTGNFTITRTFTATDDCGNSSTATQTITVQDTTAPELTIPADYTAECDEELVFDDASATDNCGTVTITLEEVTIDTDCAQEYSIERTFTATDDCGNSTTATQTITVQDTTAPTISNAGGLMNGETVEVCCESLEGDVTIPEAVTLTYSDNCDADATVDYNEECVGGNCPTETVESWCDILNPGVMADGETCDNYALHSLRLFNFPGSEFYTTVEGRVANNTDGTKTYTVTVVSTENSNAGWTVTNHYGAPMSWEDWIAQPGAQSYKSDCGLGDHTEWMYTTLTSGSAEGWGDYEGSSLSFMHQPASGYFGFQIGEGANNKNGNYGFSAWMYYNGTFDGSAVSGSGDIFGDLDCCLPYDLERSYVVSDCAGNETHFAYTVHMTGEGCDEGDEGTISDQEDTSLTSPKDLVKIESLQPNPTSDMSILVLSTEEASVTVEVKVTTMSGAEVLDLYNGVVVDGWFTTIDIPASSLESGMYQVQVRAKQFVTTKKLLVAN
ncbi:MAG: T9SS type A sorting domain-containing protein, partial [Flavobacteriales bacterium]